MPNLFKRHQRQQGRHTPNLWPVGVVAPLALLIMGGLAFGLYLGMGALLTVESATSKPVSVQDIVKTTVTVLTLIGAVLAALYAYRKQLLEEGSSHRADAAHLAERYAKAAEQLGHDQAAVRLAGVYAMARLADDWPEQRQVCINVLCAYLRMPYEADSTAAGFKEGEREVRRTIIRTIRDRLQDPASSVTLCGVDLDFTGATFDGGDFNGATFTGGRISFQDATFVTDALSFHDATFSGGTVSFNRATFSGGTVSFFSATFAGSTAFFTGMRFIGGAVSFPSATFSGGLVHFSNSTLSQGQVSFGDATFNGSRVYFSRSRFTDSEVSFDGATFSGGSVSFGAATFSGAAVFFNDAIFSGGTVAFRGATFTGSAVSFDAATFSGGTISFHDTTFADSQVSFTCPRIHPAVSIEWGPLPALPVNQP
ncbi:pentapeptide repeat-containing protein [Streptomyces sp. NPDC048156]|uniref:pentapeptide repeat-containing protein n=1 Tax=Streptomyces sp. NPDC048156 TaxID=3365502 RepID=UPI00372497CF